MKLLSFIELIWYSRSPFTWLLWPFNLPFLCFVSVKRYLYQAGLIKNNSFDKPVLVVGNITVGGTGKTPFINQLVRLLNKEKIKVGIVSRGYGAQVNHYPHQVNDQDNAITVGDEAFMQFKNFKDYSNIHCPIVIDPNRSKAIDFLIKHNNVDIIISDDGLQHYKMSRDLEIILFDGQRQLGNQLILPFGPLREPLSRLKRVSHIVQNGKQKTPFTAIKVELNPVSLIHLKTNEKTTLTDFKGQTVNAIAGIGNPQRFYNTLETICDIEQVKSFEDHHQFSLNDFEDLKHHNIVMTEKDAAKCVTFAKNHWYYLKVEMKFSKNLIDNLLRSIKPLIKNRNKENNNG
jgi:tetraacyldisaccharide 4'-kinase